MMHEMQSDVETARFEYRGFRVFMMRSEILCAHAAVYEHVAYPLAYMRIIDQVDEPIEVLTLDEVKALAIQFLDNTHQQLKLDLQQVYESDDE